MTIGLGGSFGLPSGVRKVMRLLQWADWPNCAPLEAYQAHASLYVDLKARVKRGKANREMMRRGP